MTGSSPIRCGQLGRSRANYKRSTLAFLAQSLYSSIGSELRVTMEGLFTVSDVRAATDSIETAVHFLQKHGLLAKSVKCDCGVEMRWNKRQDLKDGYTWRCPKSDCRKKLTVRRGSFFSRAKLTCSFRYKCLYSGQQKFL